MKKLSLRRLVVTSSFAFLLAGTPVSAAIDEDTSERPDCSGTGSRFTMMPVTLPSGCDLTDVDHPSDPDCKVRVDGTETALVMGKPATSAEVTVTSGDRKCSKKWDDVTSTWVDDSTNYPTTAGGRKYKAQTTLLVSAGGGMRPRMNTDHAFPEDTGIEVPSAGTRFSCVEDLLLNCEDTAGDTTVKFRKVRVRP